MEKLDTYFKQAFPNQLRLLSFQRPNRVVSKRIMNDPNVLFFGGKEWERVEEDLGNVPESDRLAFVLCLFMITISDQNLYCYFKDAYSVWRNHTQFPKFGWSGFGPHLEDPMKILIVPEDKGLIDVEGNEKLIKEFAEMFYSQADMVADRYGIEVTGREFFEAMTNDPDYTLAEGKLVDGVRRKLNSVILKENKRSYLK